MASIINFIKGLVTIARFLPELFSAISKLVKMIKDAIDDAERKKLNEKFNEALKEAQKTKDTSKVEDLFGGLDFKKEAQESATIKKEPFTIKIIEPEKKSPKLFIDTTNMNFKVSSFSASSSVIINPTVDPTTPRNTTFLGQGMGGKMGSKLLSIAVLFMIGCKSGDKLPGENAPTYKPKIFAGDSVNGGITRAQSNEFVSAVDPEFDKYLAVHQDTMSCIFQTYVNNCERFKKQQVDCKPVSREAMDDKLNRL